MFCTVVNPCSTVEQEMHLPSPNFHITIVLVTHSRHWRPLRCSVVKEMGRSGGACPFGKAFNSF